MAKYFFQTNKNMPVYFSSQKARRVLAISHFHNAIELIRVTSGKVECTIDTLRLCCDKGDVVFIPSCSVHCVISQSDDAEIQGMVFELPSLLSEDSDVILKSILNKERLSYLLFKKGSKITEELDKLFSQISKDYYSENFTKELDLRASLFKITSILANEYQMDFEEYESINRLGPVIEYIKKNLDGQIHISDLGKILNVCDDHLIRMFKKAMNITPTKYVNKLRLEKALGYLVNTDMSITEISYEVGFSSVCYMSKLFSDNLNITPSQYRKITKN